MLAQQESLTSIGLLGIVLNFLLAAFVGGGAGYWTQSRKLKAERERILENWESNWGVRQHGVYEEFFKHLAEKDAWEQEKWEKEYHKHFINFTSVFGHPEVLDKALTFKNPKQLLDDNAIEELQRLAHKELFPREYSRGE